MFDPPPDSLKPAPTQVMFMWARFVSQAHVREVCGHPHKALITLIVL